MFMAENGNKIWSWLNGWKKAVLLVSPHPYMVQLVPSAMWQSLIGRWIVEAPSDMGAGLRQGNEKRNTQFIATRSVSVWYLTRARHKKTG